MKMIFAILLACVLATSACGEEQDGTTAFRRRQSAGYVVKEGSQKGTFTFINTQKEVANQDIEAAAEIIRDDLRIKVATKEAISSDAASLVRDSEGTLGVVIVADDTTPQLLVAPEDGWAVVNVRKLSAGLQTQSAREKFLPNRVKYALIRAFAAVSGGMGSMYPGNLMSATNLNELDMASTATLPVDTKTAVERFLKSRGYSPSIRVPYRKACQEGWAPAPTNDVQRAIWDKVHSIPATPMKIEFDPKKGR